MIIVGATVLELVGAVELGPTVCVPFIVITVEVVVLF
jgi:hypothetical protein